MADPIPPSDVDAALKFAEKHIQPFKLQTLTVKDPNTNREVPIVVKPNGEVVSVKALVDVWRTAPEFRAGTAKMLNVASFVRHVNTFKDPSSTIFADPDMESASLLAIIDYHEAGYAGAPRFGKHRVSYQLPFSKEWERWFGSSDVEMTQAALAVFVEANVQDVTTAPIDDAKLKEVADLLDAKFAAPRELVQLSRSLSINENSKVTSGFMPSTGERVLRFETEHVASDGEKQVKPPSLFVIVIPVFEHSGKAYRIPVRLRYRISNGNVLWTYELFRAEEAFDKAFAEVVNQAETETGLKVLLGTPEA